MAEENKKKVVKAVVRKVEKPVSKREQEREAKIDHSIQDFLDKEKVKRDRHVSHEKVTHEKVSHVKEDIPVKKVETSVAKEKIKSSNNVSHENKVVKRTAPILSAKNENRIENDQTTRNLPKNVSAAIARSKQRMEQENDLEESKKNQFTTYGNFKSQARVAQAMNERKEAFTSENSFADSGVKSAYADGKESKSRFLTIVLAILLIMSMIIFYLIGYTGFKGRYLKNTYVNGTNIGGVKFADSNNIISANAEKSGITIIKGDGEKVTFSGDQYGLKYSVPENASYGQESHGFWFTKFFHSTNYNVDLKSTYNENALRALIRNYTWGTTAPTDAKLQKNSDGTYEIIDGQKGDMIDNVKFSDYVVNQVKKGKTEIKIDDADCYIEPDITASDLQSQLDIVNATSMLKIDIKFGDETEEISPDELAEWVTISDDGQLNIDKDKVSSYVSDLADKYDTYGKSRKFHATIDGDIEVPWTSTSIYGWQLDQTSTATKIINAIESADTEPIEPVFKQSGYGSYSKDDIGNTYIELDLSAQHVWLYKDGTCILDDDMVSGTATDPDKATPTGIYYVKAKTPNAILGTYDVQGYECPVNYWMPFTNIGIGLHDLNRRAYGGEIYKTNGSHGCINLRLSTAEKIFNNIDVGIPVICHD